MNVNFKSDFALIVNFEDGIPDYAWRVHFSTKDPRSNISRGCYTALFDGEEYLRAHPLEGSEESSLVIEFVDHGLPPGVLQAEWISTLSSEIFDSGEQRVVIPQTTEVTLIEGVSDDDVEPEVLALVAPVIKCDCDSAEGGGESTSLSTQCVSINDEGIFIDPSPDGHNNVLGGLILMAEIDYDGLLTNSWMHPSFGEDSQITAMKYNNYNYMLLINGLFSSVCSDYRIFVEPYQPALSSPLSETITYVSSRDSNKIVVTSTKVTDTSVWRGCVVMMYSTDQFWGD